MAGEHVSSITIAVFTAVVLRRRADPLPAVRAARRPLRLPPDHAARARRSGRPRSSSPGSPRTSGCWAPRAGWRAPPRAASVPSILGFIAIATLGDEGLRGKAVARFEAATLAGLGAGIVAGGAALDGPPSRRLLRQRARLRRLLGDLPVRRRRPPGRARRPRARAAHEPGALPPDPVRGPRLAPGADLDRGQRRDRAVDLPVDLPVRAGRRIRASPTSA